MNLWWINHYAVGPAHVGGTRHYSLGRELVDRGHDVTIVAASFNHFSRASVPLEHGESCRVEVIDGVRFLWVRSPPYGASGAKRLWNMLRFARDARRLGGGPTLPEPDVILGSSPHPFAALAAARLARQRRVPFVLEVRDLWPRTLVDIGGMPALHPLVLWLARIERHLYRAAARIVSVLPGAAEHIAMQGGDSGKVVWVPNGIDLSLVPEASEPAQESGFKVMYAGSHGPANQLDTVLDVARVIEREGAPAGCSFVLVGDGPEKERLRRRAAAEGLDSVRFEPPCAKRDLYTLLASADVFVATLRSSSLYRSGMSLNKLFDYLALGKPTVFGAEVESNPIAESGAGIVVAPENTEAMVRALRKLAALDPAERVEMGRKGRAFVERHHDCARLAKRLSSVLEDAASRS
jgi:glycosyltransferase involved in cell wall biosynthesis